MFRFASYILKTLWRHRIRTLLTMSGAAVALFVYCMVSTVQQSLDNLRNQADQTLIVFQANKYCPATSHLQQDYERTIAKMEGVRGILPIQVFTNNCRASLDVIVFYGVPADRLQQFRNFHMTQGSWEEFSQYQETAIVGQAVARRRNLQVGKKFSIGDISVTVAGIYTCPDSAEENYIYTHLGFLQRQGGKDLVGTVTQFEIQLEEGTNAEAMCRTIDDTFRGAPLATDTRTKGVFQTSALADLFELITLAHYLGYACVGLMIVLVMTTSLMSVQDRIREHAVLQTIGFSPWQIFGLVMTESFLLSLVGGAIGVATSLCLISVLPLSLAAEAVAITLTPSFVLAGSGLALAVGIGLVAGFFPAWQAAGTNIVTGLRQA